MRLDARDFLGRVTFITGPEKDCGKTTLLNACLALVRRTGEAPALMGVGFDGEARDALSGLRKPRIVVCPGDVFVTAERYLRESRCLPEILEVLPGSTSLGRLAIARAGRAGSVTIVGPERNEHAAWAISRIREEGWARTTLVDGAMNRITQAAAFAGARFVFALRVSPPDLERQARRACLIAALERVPVYAEGSPDFPAPAHFVEGPLTYDTAKRIPPEARTVVVDDFTKVFLDGQALSALQRERTLAFRAAVEFGGFVVVLRDLGEEAFRRALGDELAWARVAFNPYADPAPGRGAATGGAA
jgi:hypothetical protein